MGAFTGISILAGLIFILTLAIATVIGVCVKAYWYYFHQANTHRRYLEMMIVEIVRRMPLEDTERITDSIHNLLYNCHFHRHGRTYDLQTGHRHIPFIEWLKKGSQWDFYPFSQYGRDGLFLDDGYAKTGSPDNFTYRKFLLSLGIEPPAVEELTTVATGPSTASMPISYEEYKIMMDKFNDEGSQEDI